MKNQTEKRCAFCGRFFRPDKRVGDRQKSCQVPRCQKKRRQAQQKAWLSRNPGYFTGRYEYVKEWRLAHPGYQKERRGRMRGEIQTQIPPRNSFKINAYPPADSTAFL
jgi:hypothetical protein